ncbi:MAG: hypothetical protein FJY07_05140 [Bacteroidetes bacterium]|nr:hypothetical protein [Bacteroidota bacterium]
MKNNNLQTEIDACFLYRKHTENEADSSLVHIFSQMSVIERSHAEAITEKQNISLVNMIKPSWWAKTPNMTGRIFGYDYVLA